MVGSLLRFPFSGPAGHVFRRAPSDRQTARGVSSPFLWPSSKMAPRGDGGHRGSISISLSLSLSLCMYVYIYIYIHIHTYIHTIHMVVLLSRPSGLPGTLSPSLSLSLSLSAPRPFLRCRLVLSPCIPVASLGGDPLPFEAPRPRHRLDHISSTDISRI